MADYDVVSRAAKLMRVKYINKDKRNKGKWKTSYCIMLKGSRSVALMKKLRPFMGKRRKKQIDRALASYRSDPFKRSGPKLTQKLARKIRRKAEKLSTRELATRYEVSTATILRIVSGKTWAKAA